MNEKNRVLDIDIERYVLGELPAERVKEVEEVLASDPEGQARLSAIDAENAAILEAYPPHLMAVQIQEKAAQADAARVQARRRILVPVISLSAVAAAVLMVIMMTPAPQQQEGIRLKGLDPEPSLFVYRHKEKGKEERLRKGATATVGDLVQLRYSSKGQKYGVIFSVDGRGTVSLHHPLSEDGSTVLEKKLTTLDSSYELDDAPKFERFFFVTSNKPIDVSEIIEKARGVGENGELTLSKEFKASDFILKKK